MPGLNPGPTLRLTGGPEQRLGTALVLDLRFSKGSVKFGIAIPCIVSDKTVTSKVENNGQPSISPDRRQWPALHLSRQTSMVYNIQLYF